MEKIVQVSEQEVRIDFSLNRKCRANVRLTSLSSTCPVAFKVQTSSPHKFLVKPPTGLIPPLSYATFQVVLKPQSQIPTTYPRSPSDRFLIKTAEFVSDSTRPEAINSWFNSSSCPRGSIIPISDTGDRGLWFRIESESDFRAKQIQIPRNTRRVVLELYVSFHGNDEFWYSNPPSLYITTNNLTTGRGNGAYREVFVTVDGEMVGSIPLVIPWFHLFLLVILVLNDAHN